MPTILVATSVRADAANSSLLLNAAHRIQVSSSSDTLCNQKKGPWPLSVDVHTASDVTLSISGFVNRSPVGTDPVKSSAVLAHLIHYLKTNASALGLNTVSDAYIDQDNRLNISITPSRPSRHITAPLCALLSIDLVYVWKSTSQDAFADTHPFSPQLLLPIKSILDKAVEKFAVNHLVKRYPLIFGPWRERLDMEVALFPSIARSILRMAYRSLNDSFRTQCERYIRILKKRSRSVDTASVTALQSYLGTSICLGHADDEDHNDETVLCEAMTRLFKLGVRPTRFKGSIAGLDTRDGGDDHGFDMSLDDHPSTTDVRGNCAAEGKAMLWDTSLPSIGVDILDDTSEFNDKDDPCWGVLEHDDVPLHEDGEEEDGDFWLWCDSASDDRLALDRSLLQTLQGARRDTDEDEAGPPAHTLSPHINPHQDPGHTPSNAYELQSSQSTMDTDCGFIPNTPDDLDDSWPPSVKQPQAEGDNINDSLCCSYDTFHNDNLILDTEDLVLCMDCNYDNEVDRDASHDNASDNDFLTFGDMALASASPAATDFWNVNYVSGLGVLSTSAPAGLGSGSGPRCDPIDVDTNFEFQSLFPDADNDLPVASFSGILRQPSMLRSFSSVHENAVSFVDKAQDGTGSVLTQWENRSWDEEPDMHLELDTDFSGSRARDGRDEVGLLMFEDDGDM